MRIGTAQWKEKSRCREDRILHWDFFYNKPIREAHCPLIMPEKDVIVEDTRGR